MNSSCEICGVPLKAPQKRFCSTEHRLAWWREAVAPEARKKGLGVMRQKQLEGVRAATRVKMAEGISQSRRWHQPSGYVSAEQKAAEWRITHNYVLWMARRGMIPGSIKDQSARGRMWWIPANAQKPESHPERPARAKRKEIVSRAKKGEKVAFLSEEYEVSRQTIYNYLEAAK